MSELTPRERRAANTQQAIIAAARKIILRDGLEALSMRNLAEAIDYTPAAIYKYFENKDAILAAIREEGFELLGQVTARRMAGIANLKPAEQLVHMGKAYLEFAELYPDHYQLMMSSADNAPNSLDELEQHPAFINMVAFLERAQAAGQIKIPAGYTARTLRYQIWFMTHGIAMLRISYLSKAKDELDQVIDEIMQNFVNQLIDE